MRELCQSIVLPFVARFRRSAGESPKLNALLVHTKQIREAGRSTQGVRLLHLDAGDKVAASVVIPQETPDENGTLLQ